MRSSGTIKIAVQERLPAPIQLIMLTMIRSCPGERISAVQRANAALVPILARFPRVPADRYRAVVRGGHLTCLPKFPAHKPTNCVVYRRRGVLPTGGPRRCRLRTVPIHHRPRASARSTHGRQDRRFQTLDPSDRPVVLPPLDATSTSSTEPKESERVQQRVARRQLALDRFDQGPDPSEPTERST